MRPQYLMKTEEMFPQLTKGLKKVAEYFMNDPIIFAIHPAKKIGEFLNVSETMVIRFCKAIGYEFSDLQKDIRKDLVLLNSNQLFGQHADSDNNFSNYMNEDITLMKKNQTKLNKDVLDQAVTTILNSEQIVVVGFYQSFAFAHWLFFNLNHTLGNAILYRPESDARLLDRLPEKSCLIVYSFFRYAIDPIKLAEHAKKKGIPVIAITDSKVAPITEFADTVIVVHVGNDFSFFRIGPVTFSVTNTILEEIVHRVKSFDFIPNAFNYFIKDVKGHGEY